MMIAKVVLVALATFVVLAEAALHNDIAHPFSIYMVKSPESKERVITLPEPEQPKIIKEEQSVPPKAEKLTANVEEPEQPKIVIEEHPVPPKAEKLTSKVEPIGHPEVHLDDHLFIDHHDDDDDDWFFILDIFDFLSNLFPSSANIISFTLHPVNDEVEVTQVKQPEPEKSDKVTQKRHLDLVPSHEAKGQTPIAEPLVQKKEDITDMQTTKPHLAQTNHAHIGQPMTNHHQVHSTQNNHILNEHPKNNAHEHHSYNHHIHNEQPRTNNAHGHPIHVEQPKTTHPHGHSTHNEKPKTNNVHGHTTHNNHAHIGPQMSHQQQMPFYHVQNSQPKSSLLPNIDALIHQLIHSHLPTQQQLIRHPQQVNGHPQQHPHTILPQMIQPNQPYYPLPHHQQPKSQIHPQYQQHYNHGNLHGQTLHHPQTVTNSPVKPPTQENPSKKPSETSQEKLKEIEISQVSVNEKTGTQTNLLEVHETHLPVTGTASAPQHGTQIPPVQPQYNTQTPVFHQYSNQTPIDAESAPDCIQYYKETVYGTPCGVPISAFNTYSSYHGEIDPALKSLILGKK